MKQTLSKERKKYIKECSKNTGMTQKEFIEHIKRVYNHLEMDKYTTEEIIENMKKKMKELYK